MAKENPKPAADELTELFPEAETVTVAGEAISIEPLTIAKLGRVAKALQAIGESLSATDMPTLCAEHTEQAIEAVAAATGKPIEFIGGLRADEFLRLAMAVFRVNADFFAQRLAPLVAEATTLVTAKLGAGQTPSASSSAAGT